MRRIASLLIANIALVVLLISIPPTRSAASMNARTCGVDIHCCCQKSTSGERFCCVDCADECELKASKECWTEGDCG